jgi:galactose mutarotase-like enzyme
MATAPWGEVLDPGIPGHLRRLGGEFFCLPFGGGGTVRDPVPGWESLTTVPGNEPMHGPPANEDWQIIAHDRNHVRMVINLPDEYPVSRIERRITLGLDRPSARTDVTLEIRRDGRVPVAFHPILRLPENLAQLVLSADFAQGFTYPAVIEPDRMATEPGREFARLEDVPKRRGGSVDLTHLPFGARVDDAILLAGMKGPIRASFLDEGFGVTIDWPRDLLPHCLLWIHDRGIDVPPWNGSYRGIGIEPMAAAFDAPWAVSVGDNPLNAAGFPTALEVSLGRPVELYCEMSVATL